MFLLFKKWIDIHEDEVSLFLWSLVLLFLIRSSGIIFNNFAETAFLKRYGVEYLPIVYMLNSIITFVIMALLAGLMIKLESTEILSYVLLFCSASAVVLRFIIPLNLNLIYPLLYILKAQFEILLGLLFWNLVNELFNIRQSKRLFPLIVAGGVIGEILGSFGTPILGRLISLNNLMLAYAVNTMLAFVIIFKMKYQFPALLVSNNRDKTVKPRPSVAEQLRNIRSLTRETPLVTILIILTLLPNIIIPILNYQFNYAIDSQFATEDGIIQFFGYFRGAMNIVSLVLLLFVGKVYNRLGLPIALMFHPVNYMLVFMAFLFRFDLISAMYARLSTNVIRTTFNKPVTDVLMGIFPGSYRSQIRPFLRGTVVRIGLFGGSGLVLISESWFHPKYLSLAAIPIVVIWIATTFFLKKNYAKILSGMLSRNMLDMKSIDDQDVNHLFKDIKTQEVLIQTFRSSTGDDALWYANLLQSLSIGNLDTLIVSTLQHHDIKTQIGLLNMISEKADDHVVQTLEEMADIENQDLFVAIIKTLKRIQTDTCTLISEEMIGTNRYPEVRAYAAACIYQSDPERYHETVVNWLNSEKKEERIAGVIAAGESNEKSHINNLERMLETQEDPKLIPLILHALWQLKAKELDNRAIHYFTHDDESVRLAALDAVEIHNDQTLQRVIQLLGDPSDHIHHKTKDKILTASYQNGKLLIESLNMPKKRLREGIFSLLKTLEIKKHDTFLFARSQIENSYINLAMIKTLKRFPATIGRGLLHEHFEHKIHENIECLFRVLSVQDNRGQIRVVFRNLFSQNNRQKANALELLDGIMEPSLFRLLIPLLDGTSLSSKIETGRKKFDLPGFGPDINQLYLFLLNWKCWVSSVLALYCIQEDGLEDKNRDAIVKLTQSQNPVLRQEALRVLNISNTQPQKGNNMETDISIPGKILFLKKIAIFKKLSVNELAAIASITEKVEYSPGEIIFREHDIAETMYLIIDGELSTLKNETETVGTFVSGENIGEAALLLDGVRLLTVRAEVRTQLLVIHKQDFIEIVREYPQIGLEISRALASHVQRLLAKVTGINSPEKIEQPT